MKTKKKKKKFLPYQIACYCENAKRHLVWEEVVLAAKDPGLYLKWEKEVGSAGWLFLKGILLMDLYQYIGRIKKIKDMKGWYKLFKEQGRDPKQRFMYDEYLMRDITLEEWAAFQCNAKSYSYELRKSKPSRLKLDKRLTLVVANFLEEKDGKPKSCSSKDGWYEDLWDELDQHGIDMYDIDMRHIETAWRIYRSNHPRPDPKPLEDELVDLRKKTRDNLWGFSITAVIRTMGKEGFDFRMTKRALKALGADVADNTIRVQLRYARIDFKLPAPLNPDQIDKLWELS